MLHVHSSMIPDIIVYDNYNFPFYLLKKTDVYGFAIPTGTPNNDKEREGAVLVNIKWNSSLLIYKAKFEAVTIDKFEERVLKIYEFQKSCPLTEIDPADFDCFPMGRREISAILSTEITDLLHSTYSLLAFTDVNVFKLSLAATDGLDGLLRVCRGRQSCPCQILLPPPSTVDERFLCFSRF